MSQKLSQKMKQKRPPNAVNPRTCRWRIQKGIFSSEKSWTKCVSKFAVCKAKERESWCSIDFRRGRSHIELANILIIIDTACACDRHKSSLPKWRWLLCSTIKLGPFILINWNWINLSRKCTTWTFFIWLMPRVCLRSIGKSNI